MINSGQALQIFAHIAPTNSQAWIGKLTVVVSLCLLLLAWQKKHSEWCKLSWCSPILTKATLAKLNLLVILSSNSHLGNWRRFVIIVLLCNSTMALVVVVVVIIVEFLHTTITTTTNAIDNLTADTASTATNQNATNDRKNNNQN